MCGIVGGWWGTAPADLEGKAKRALLQLKHRGPDDDGYEISSEKNGVVLLGQTRLSIIDLTSAGHQPMLSACGRYVVVFNGEIYNYRELRSELRALGHTFRSDSDTEVLLTAWMHWREECLSKFEGMFAFVVLDKSAGTLTCARDAFGIKPFFYTQGPLSFLFASEQSALLTLRGETPRINWQRSYDYLVHGDYDSNEDTFIYGVNHLMPGHWLEVDLATGKVGQPECWWPQRRSPLAPLTFDQAVEAVRDQFLKNIRLHLRSDVALGVALSGGIDSSATVCAMRYVEPTMDINAFSYIAPDKRISEEQWVDKVVLDMSCKVHKVTATGEELLRDLDSMILAQGEPFGSTSIYAQYRVFQLARQSGVTVTLDGQGADELLAGYSGYPGHRLLSLLEEGRPWAAQKFAAQWSKWPGRSYKLAWMELGKIKLPNGLYAAARRRLGRDFAPRWLRTDLMQEAGINFSEQRPPLDSEYRTRRVTEALSRSLQYRGLPGLLRHGDRNSMAFSVESRVPFLTLPMADLLLSLPEDYLISSSGETKSVFRAAMREIVPDYILDRRDKIGFATPEQHWLLGMGDTLREWLSQSDEISFLDRKALLESFEAIVQGRAQFSWQLWRWVNFVRWQQLTGAVS